MLPTRFESPDGPYFQQQMTLAGALLPLAASHSPYLRILPCTAHNPLTPQVTGLVADASTASLAGAALSLAASSSASRRRRQLLDLTLAPQQVRA